MHPPQRIVILGATGAVGSATTDTLVQMAGIEALTLLGRRRLETWTDPVIDHRIVDVFDPSSYAGFLAGHEAAICTFGVGQPSKVTRDEFVRLDKMAVLDFASSCREADVRHFQLLGSIGANAQSRSFFLRTKGELEDGLKNLGFERLSLFQPSMILTPTNRYGFPQALMLAIWPKLGPFMVGSLRRYRGVPVERLGEAMAVNTRTPGRGVETLQWDQIRALSQAYSSD